MNSKEVVKRTVRFQKPARLAYDFSEEFGSDFVLRSMTPNPDSFLSKGTDEWGAVWDNIGNSQLGQVVDYPVKEWKDFKTLKVPDVTRDDRWQDIKNARVEYGDKFLLCSGLSIFERLKFLRGVENGWTDPLEYPEETEELLDILVDLNLKAIKKCGELGVDGYFMIDDWGVQNSLIMPPLIFRKFWKPRYAKIFKAVHEMGMLSFLHSCGYIVEILDDLIEAGLDVIQMDQQENMGLELLGKRFGGRITFFSPVDIQNTMIFGTLDDIRNYCRKMVKHLWRPEGGFISRCYSDPVGAGHSPEAVKVMCEEFLKISREIYS